jgi:hypothetical protein
MHGWSRRRHGELGFVPKRENERRKTKLNLAKELVAVQTNAMDRRRESGKMTGLAIALAAAAVLSLLTTCGSGGSGGSSSGTSGGSNASATVPATGTTAFRLGVDVNTISWWDGSRPFANLIYGTDWQMQGPSGGAVNVPADDLDANGWVKRLPAGYQVFRGLSVPASTGNYICRFQGNGSMIVGGPSVTNVTNGAGFTTFTLTATYPNPQLAYIKYDVDPSNYIRNIDCREASAMATTVFAPEFLSAIRGFKVVRFMKWQPATEGNWAVTWATRNKPGDGNYTKNDGVPVEVMVDMANQIDADPWFTVPWNADNDYISHFATYVRDHLASGRQVYVETSNEVWNGSYAVSTQAANEAKAEGLPSSGVTATAGALERYAEKTQEVMQIWSTVFAGQSNRLVRVAAFQHVSPYSSDLLLKYRNLYQSVDALATAPYFGHDADSWSSGQSLDSIMTTILPAKVKETLDLAAQQKANAQKYNLRYVTYEGGQHIILSGNQALLAQIERDPRMGDLYKSFVAGWQTGMGDTMTLFALTGPVSSYGAWGLSEYAGQPSNQAPKMSAAREFLD